MTSFENHLLIAMPNMHDPYFQKTVTYICEHNEQGAMGLIVNVPVRITLGELLSQIDAHQGDSYRLSQRVLAGGPVSPDRGFVLHNNQGEWSSSMALNSEIMITTSRDILEALGTDKAPEQFLVTLGYAGWGPGQLEQEIKDNSWLVAQADRDILFDTPVDLRWQKATQKLGIDLGHLSTDIGHA
ncbi:YqgE/AlgH family protein [Thalassotalea ponticola]|uniref:YqgE/AlgH family protein n=1 Tax=Thalassotalea ponticola TaxID=1523392 RepID=UPI0025B495E9|nr:YqgE/AlgH family protein [Thalassotalea ponticola]MDN3652106.1 YqgE/AlgH family protein [Thalassotalea ponticola]